MGPVVNDGTVADHGRPVDHHAALDLDSLAQEYRPVQLSVWRDLNVLFGPHTATDMLPDFLCEIHATFQDVKTGSHVFLYRAYVGPVPLGDVAIQRFAGFEEPGKEVLAKVVMLPVRDALQDFGLEYVDACVYRVGNDFTPTGLFQELLNMALIIYNYNTVL